MVIYDKNAKSQYDFNSTKTVQVASIDRLLDEELENYKDNLDCGRTFASTEYIRMVFNM